MIEIPRRRFLAGLVGLIAAPAVVKAASLMPVKAFDGPLDLFATMEMRLNGCEAAFLEEMSRRWTNAVLYGSSHPELFQGFVPLYGSHADFAA